MTVILILSIISTIAELGTILKIVLGSITAFVVAMFGIHFKKRRDNRKQDLHDSKISNSKREDNLTEIKDSTEAIESLRQGVEKLNILWVEENTLRTKAEASSIRRGVALELMKSICPDCYEKLPKHLR